MCCNINLLHIFADKLITTMENKSLNEKLMAFQKKITAIKKDATNPHFKSTYASLPQILSEVKPILNDVGLVLTQPIKDNSVFTCLSDGSNYIESGIPLPSGLNPQQIGSAITYYRRYTLASLLSLEIDDDDANEASKPLPKPTQPEKPWLTDGMLQKAIDRIKTGEPDVISKLEQHYKINKSQREQLNKAIV